ncbi:MAG: putative ribonuclease [Candidatus Angelobacter sp.]|jgi:membrane protein|nr:putative ribonuclease [Candidatus Angelobacter sp.]
MPYMLRTLSLLRRAFWRSFQHGVFMVSKGAAYSSILTFFPALILAAWVMSVTNTTESFVHQIETALGAVLPPGSRTTALSYFRAHKKWPVREIISASTVMVFAASGVMISWMNGFRTAYGIQKNPWGFWRERAVAIFLVILGLAPMAFALFLVAFGNIIEIWLVMKLNRGIGLYVLLLWTAGRWLISAVTSVTVIMLIYHWGLPRVQPWHRVLPGAIMATVLWFPVTIVFGWYVTNYANYNLIYGSLGAGIALLVWLYIISIIILVGAEFNSVACPRALEKMPEERVEGDRRQRQRRKSVR